MSDERRPAVWWRRLAARAVDLVTVFFCLFAVALLGGGALIDGATDARVAYVALLGLYEVVFTGLQGQTPGKDLLRVKVAPIGTAESPGIRRALVRWALPGLVLLLPHPAVAGAALLATGLTVPLRPAGRAVHDLLAGTWVVDYHADEEEDLEEEASSTAPLDRFRRQHGVFRRLWE